MLIEIVARRTWGAKPASLPADRMILPARRVWLHHTITEVSDKPFVDMRKVESVGLQRFRQFSYSYCIHPDGTLMEGCGTRIGAHTQGQNSTSFGIALIGNYNTRGVTVWQIDAVRWLIHTLIMEGKLLPPGQLVAGYYPNGGHRDAIDPDTGKPTATACPGEKAYRLLDAMRVPWNLQKGIPMADNPEIHNIEGPLSFHMLQTSEGICTGYAIFGTMTGELHGYGPGWKYHGRSEDPTPDDEQG